MFDALPNLPAARRWRQQAHPAPIVVALIQAADGRFLLIRRSGAPYAGQWALVGGKWEFGETLPQAIVREVAEETGLAARFVALRGLVSERVVAAADMPAATSALSAAPSAAAAHFLLFVCQVTAVGEAREQAEGAVAWFTRPEIDDLHAAGAIIPSDYAMLARFGAAETAVAHVEADMRAPIGPGAVGETVLVRFEGVAGERGSRGAEEHN